MSVSLYMDYHVPWAITLGLRQRGVDVLTTQDDGTAAMGDSQLLDRATALGRAMYTQDKGFLKEAAARHQRQQPFASAIYVHQLSLSLRRRIDDLEMIAKAADPPDLENQIWFLPL